MIEVNIKQVKANPNNPRIIKDVKFKKLVKSIQEFPDMLNKRPLIVFTDVDGKYCVLGGNMRLKALNELKYTKIPVIVADEWNEEQKAEFLIKDNVGFGEWDWDILANEWDAEKLDDWAIDVWQLTMNNDFDGAEDIVTNNGDYDHIDDQSIHYLNNDMKKFEVYIKKDEYETVVSKINHIKKTQNCKTNSDAIVWLILNS